MRRINLAMIILGALAGPLLSTQAHASEIASWNNTVAGDFSTQQCLVVHGSPGVPEKCAPSYSHRFPCPTIKHPGKSCTHTIAGPCTPGTPGTPDVKQCANVSLGKFSIAVDGGVYTQFEGIEDSEVLAQTTVHVSLFGKQAAVPVSCKISIGTETSICLNLLTRTFAPSNVSGYSCEIMGEHLASITYPGVTANLCMDVAVGGNPGKPEGSLTARVEADVEFGSAKIGEHSVSMGSKGWNPTLFSSKF